MSQTAPYAIRCPKCNAHQDEILYDTVDVGKEPELRKQLMENKLNTVVCNACGFRFRVDKQLLYNESKAGWMIFLNPHPIENSDQAEEEFRHVLEDLRDLMPSGAVMPEVDLVLSRVELVERVFVREAGFNPRVIEYVKYLIYTQNLDQFMPEEKALLLNGQECTEEHLSFVVQDVHTHKLETLLQYSREAYNSLVELLTQDGELSLVHQLFPGPYASARAYLVQDEV